MKKVILPAFLILVTAAPFAAASGNREDERLGLAGPEKPVFAWLAGSDDPFTVSIEKGVRARAAELGVTVLLPGQAGGAGLEELADRERCMWPHPAGRRQESGALFGNPRTSW